jgi:hypothetical protein
MFVLEMVWAVAPPLDEDAGVPMPDAGSITDAGPVDGGIDAGAPSFDGGRPPRRDSGHRDPPEVWAARGGGCTCVVSGRSRGPKAAVIGALVMFVLAAARFLTTLALRPVLAHTA